jgi:hypothetical protein
MGIGGKTETAHEGEDAAMSGCTTSCTDLVAGGRRDDSAAEAVFF